jgi:hypothetical protein
MTTQYTKNQFADYLKQAISRFTPGFVYYFDRDIYLNERFIPANVCYRVSNVDYHIVSLTLVTPCSKEVFEKCEYSISFSTQVYSLEKLTANGLMSVSCLYPFQVGQVLKSSKIIHLHGLIKDERGESYIGEFDTKQFLIKIEGYTLKPHYMTLVSVDDHAGTVFQAHLMNQNYDYEDLVRS